MAAVSAVFLRATAAELRAAAAGLTEASERLDDANAGVIGWLRAEAGDLEAAADGYEQAIARATAYAEPGLTEWVTGFRARVASAGSLEGLAALGAEARAATAEGRLPDVVAEQLQAAFRARAAELAARAPSAAAVVERIEARRRRMFALLGELDLTDRVAYRGYMAEILGRPVETSKSLTAPETEQVVARLEAAVAQQEPQPVEPDPAGAAPGG